MVTSETLVSVLGIKREELTRVMATIADKAIIDNGLWQRNGE
jgi:hypothetical protein